MNAVVDIGNSRVKTALFNDNKMVRSRVFSLTAAATIKRFFKPLATDTPVIISDVTLRHRTLIAGLKKKYKLLINLSSRTPIPVKIKYQNKKTLGNDRIANAVAGSMLFPGKPVLVIDAGTCLKIDFVNAKAQYLGGSISPGMTMRYESLNRYTALLPLVKPSSTPELTGNDTQQSIVSGVQLGMLYEMEGAVRAYRKRYKGLNVILAGGDWIYFANQLKNPIFVAPDLTLLGLNKILNYNHSGDS